MLPVDIPNWSSDLPVNWKSVRDVDNEGYHVPLAHPGLQDLYGRDCRDLYMDGGLHASFGFDGDKPGRGWSVKRYLGMAREEDGLPPHLRQAWTYYGLFPNVVFAFTPEGAQYYQDAPLSPGMTRVTGRMYRRPNETRQQRLSRYLAYRIDRETSVEDQQLSIWSNESMKSQAFDGFHLSDLEWGGAAAPRAVAPGPAGDDAGPRPRRGGNRAAKSGNAWLGQGRGAGFDQMTHPEGRAATGGNL